jgi:hypothetical protein
VVRVFENLRGEGSVGSRKLLLKIGDGGSLTQIELVLNLHFQRGAGPGVLDSLERIPFAHTGVCNLGEQDDEVEPRQLVSRLLTNL